MNYTLRFISWLVSNIVEPEMEKLGHKKNSCEKRIFTRQKWFWKMHYKTVEVTYKSKILKFEIQYKVSNKQDAE